MALTLGLSVLGNLVVALFVLVCVSLILIVLLQKGRGGGLGAAFGGGAGSLLGTKTGDFLTWVTIALVAGFLVLAVLMGKFMGRPEASSALSLPTAQPGAMQAEITDTEADAEETDTPAEVEPVVDEEVEEAAEAAMEAVEPVEEAVDDEMAGGESESTPISPEELAEEMIN